MNDLAFTLEQKEYLDGFFKGLQVKKGEISVNEPSTVLLDAKKQLDQSINLWYGTNPEDICKEEKLKMEENPFHIWDKLVQHAEEGKFPQGGDIFRFKFSGLFYVSPAQEAFMLRVRTPGNIMAAHQMRGLSEIAQRWGDGKVTITTRGNVQIREIQPKNILQVIYKLQQHGILHKGSGADNVRNITATPTTGFDCKELLDVRPFVDQLQQKINYEKDFFGLPRKFNIAFDSGGTISVVADTNDIAFSAVEVESNNQIESGIYFQVHLAGITGHKQFAKPTGLVVKPEKSVSFAGAILKVFAANGDRTNRKKARLKYLIDSWGMEKFLQEVQKEWKDPLTFIDDKAIKKAQNVIKHAHIGIHPQKTGKKFYMGVAVPVGRIAADQFLKLANIAEKYGGGEVRLTVWQNLLIPHVNEEDLEVVKKETISTGLNIDATSISGGIITCTGNTGCKFAATDTKGHGLILIDYLTRKLKLDSPINIHLTGCPHSCAQHYIGDIGLLGTVITGDDGKNIEGYNIVIGGGSDQEQSIAQELVKNVPFDKIPLLIEKILNFYSCNRATKQSFHEFVKGQNVIEEIKKLVA